MRARPLGRVRRQCSKRSANSVNASSAGVSIGVDIGSISQIDHEMGLYLRSATLQMSRTLTGSTRTTKSHGLGSNIKMQQTRRTTYGYCMESHVTWIRRKETYRAEAVCGESRTHGFNGGGWRNGLNRALSL